MKKTKETLLLNRQVLLMNYLSTFAMVDTPKYRGIRKKLEQAIDKIDQEIGDLDILANQHFYDIPKIKP